MPMTFSAEQIDKIREAAAALMSLTEIAILIGCEKEELKGEFMYHDSPAYKAYMQGKTETVLLLKKQNVKLALGGSPLAMQQAEDYLINMNDDELKL